MKELYGAEEAIKGLQARPFNLTHDEACSIILHTNSGKD